MIEEKETAIDYDAILGDFDGFLKERNWEECNAIIDNLRDLGEYEKGIELAKRLTARKMTVPADYGEEKKDWRGKPVKTYGHAEFEADNGFDVW